MSSLEALVRPATNMINRQIRAKTPARELCGKLAGRVMAIRVTNTALAIYLVADEDELRIATEYEQDPDVLVSGSMLALTRMAGPAGEAVIRHGQVALSGDALVAQDFQKLLQYGRPDLEEELSAVIGDVAAHGIGEFFRGIGEWGRDARSTMRQNVGEYLQEESRSVPTREEVDAFQEEVDTLRDDVARFEARLNAVEPASSSQENA
jgi:ubiquinone biosynthesis protein UbiJ